MRVKISSPVTLFYKVVFPGLWLLAAVAAAAAKAWILAGLFVLFFCALLLYAIQLKQVILDTEHDYLEISNYFKSQRVPCSSMSGVMQRVWRNPDTVWITFGTATEFGARIAFIPKLAEAWFSAEHPVVNDLRNLIKAQSDRQRRVG